jgi:hypothetical protein
MFIGEYIQQRTRITQRKMLRHYDSIDAAKKVKKKATDKTFILAVVNKVTAYRKKRLLGNEVEGLVHYIKEVDFNLLKRLPPDAVVDKIAKNFASQLAINAGTSIDTQELMKGQIGAINPDDQSFYSTQENRPYSATYSGNNPDTDGVTDQFWEFNGSDPFGARARNTSETNAVYHGVDGDDEEYEIMKKANGGDPPRRLENVAQPFNSNKFKYPRIAKQKVQNVYLLLDSRNRNLTTDNSTFQWAVRDVASTGQGAVNTLSDQIHNITNVQFDRSRIPYVPTGDNVYRKISLYIKEFESSSVLLANGRRYHMLFDSEIIGNQIELTPLINDEGRFRFYTPINELSTITIQFKSPFSPVTFLPDRYNITVTSLNATQSILTFPENHNVADGELVHLTEFDTDAPVADTHRINFINQEIGHVVTFINDTVLRIEADLTTITPSASNLTNCFIASRRLIFPIRMEYLIV